MKGGINICVADAEDVEDVEDVIIVSVAVVFAYEMYKPA